MANIKLLDKEYSNVPDVTLPKTDGGTVTFYLNGGGGSPNLQTKSVSYTATTSTQTAEVTASSGYDGLDKVNVTVNAIPAADADGTIQTSGFVTENGVRKWKVTVAVYAETPGWLPEGISGGSSVTAWDAIAAGTTVTPSESQQTVGSANVMLEGPITVSAITSNYVGTGVTRRTDGDIVGVFDDGVYSVNVPPGYYRYASYTTVPTGSEGTPVATTSTVSNHSITVTPVVVNTGGYIEGGTRTGTPIVITAEDLGGGGAKVDTKTLTNSSASATDLTFTGLLGKPIAFFLRCTASLSRSSSSSYYYVADMRYNGTNVTGNCWRMSNGNFTNITSGYSQSYSNGTLNISSSGSRSSSPGSFYNGGYELVYVY